MKRFSYIDSLFEVFYSDGIVEKLPFGIIWKMGIDELIRVWQKVELVQSVLCFALGCFCVFLSGVGINSLFYVVTIRRDTHVNLGKSALLYVYIDKR